MKISNQKAYKLKKRSKVYQINTKPIESQKRYNDLKRQGCKFYFIF